MSRQADINLMQKYFPQSKVQSTKRTVPQVSLERNNAVLRSAFNAWSSLDEFRINAHRNKMYTFGNQWGDFVPNPNGQGWITEERLITKEGNVPLKNNRIRGIVRSTVGVFSGNQTEPVCVSRERDDQGKGEMMSATIQYVYQLNKLWELDRSNFEYFLVSGLAAFKGNYEWREGGMNVWNDLVNYNRFFFDNHMEDPRHWDCSLVGEIHDMSINSLIGKFANSPESAQKLREIYGGVIDEDVIETTYNLTRSEAHRNRNFFIPDDPSRCRVIEVWRKEAKERLLVHDRLTGDCFKTELKNKSAIDQENHRRIAMWTLKGIHPDKMLLIKADWFMDEPWMYYFMTPTGYVLKTGETEYWHGSHPYSFKVYPFYDSEVHPFVGDFIDQQRFINRLIMMQDLINKTSAKGVLMFPEDQKPDHMSMDEIAETWASYRGIIYYKPKPGTNAPEQIINNSSNPGLFQMLQIQLKLIEDVSGVQGSLQGQTPPSGTAASLFMQQTQNATTSLTDLFESYREVRETRDIKNMKLIQQYYEEPRYINVSGVSKKSFMYNPELVQNSEFDLSITESTATPAYRMIMNDFLMQLFNQQAITLDQLLDMGTFPFADKLKQSIEARKQEAAAGQPMGQVVPPEVQQQINNIPQQQQVA